MLGYLSILALAVLCAVLYFIILKIQVQVLRRTTAREVCRERMMLDSLVVEQDRAMRQSEGQLALFPIISNYLCQSTIILNNSLQLDDLIMIKATSEQVQQLLNEIKMAPEELRNLVIEQYNINKRLAELKHPVRTFMEEFKIKTMFAFARSVIKLLEKIPSMHSQLKKREELLRLEMLTLCCELAS